MNQKTEPAAGLVVVDKPAGLTSHDVVARLRRRFGTRRVGHGGTLDPMATGVLVVGIGAGTKVLQFVTDADKSYTATIRLGQATHTDDAEGEVVGGSPAGHLGDDQIAAALARQVGQVQQVPSAVSAIKVAGRRAYDRVRAGEVVELAPRPVQIKRIELLGIRRAADLVEVDIAVDCSKGTYIRAIARDLGVDLAVGGHLTALRRTAVGGFTEEMAADWESAALLPLADVLAKLMPVIEVDAAEAEQVRHGRRLAWRWHGEAIDPVAVFDAAGGLLAIGRRQPGEAGDELAYHSVLAGNLAG